MSPPLPTVATETCRVDSNHLRFYDNRTRIFAYHYCKT
jgi:hypothetical protein